VKNKKKSANYFKTFTYFVDSQLNLNWHGVKEREKIDRASDKHEANQLISLHINQSNSSMRKNWRPNVCYLISEPSIHSLNISAAHQKH